MIHIEDPIEAAARRMRIRKGCHMGIAPEPPDLEQLELDWQEAYDRSYWANGPRCSGCDHWEGHSLVGECRRSAPVPFDQRFGMLKQQIHVVHINRRVATAGHVMTDLDHVCGEFADTFEWSTLDPEYLKRIGHPCAT